MLYGNTDDGSSALWVCDGNGVVVDNISIYGAERAPILEQINEHYGTSFTGWSDNEIGLRFGDSIPDWNAYEKIMLPMSKFYTEYDTNKYIFGQILTYGNDRVGDINIKGNGKMWLCDINGVILEEESTENVTEELRQTMVSKVNAAGGNVVGFTQSVKTYEPGTTLEQWQSYVRV